MCLMAVWDEMHEAVRVWLTDQGRGLGEGDGKDGCAAATPRPPAGPPLPGSAAAQAPVPAPTNHGVRQRELGWWPLWLQTEFTAAIPRLARTMLSVPRDSCMAIRRVWARACHLVGMRLGAHEGPLTRSRATQAPLALKCPSKVQLTHLCTLGVSAASRLACPFSPLALRVCASLPRALLPAAACLGLQILGLPMPATPKPHTRTLAPPILLHCA